MSLLQTIAAVLLVFGSVLVVGMLWLLDTVSAAAVSGPRLREIENPEEAVSDLRQAA